MSDPEVAVANAVGLAQDAPTEPALSDEAYQRHILQGVSRTFALTIPQLPEELRRVVGNAYLLCRIADTIEDEPAMTAAEKRRLAASFVGLIGGEGQSDAFAQELGGLLSENCLDAERDLVAHTGSVIRMTRNFNPVQRAALHRCVRIMADGMAEYQENESPDGLRDMGELDRYCYHVAGVVGEMLTELFCDHCPQMVPHKEKLMRLAVSFGQGLQMTNILKDVWEDRARGACWLPRDVFHAQGFELANLSQGGGDPAFARGIELLIGVARGHLEDALEYTLSFPARERGIRRFCLWALGMAVLTLRKLNSNLAYSSGAQVKISRRSVRATIAVTNGLVSHDYLLRVLLSALSRSLPPVRLEV